jgi:acetylornithine/succinyldiaminopimelate/putrescine aminotransferase
MLNAALQSSEAVAQEPALLPVYAQMPLHPVSGRGCWLIDDAGEQWLDLYGGHAVASTGHSHPEVVAAIAAQAAKLLFYSTALPHPNRERLAEKLASLCPAPLEKIFFCNSGAEANENALHLARRVTGRRAVVSVRGGWHGRTAATLACTDGAHYEAGALRAGMPLSRKVAFGDIAGLAEMIDETVAAFIVEPVQGVAGARDCSREFLAAARARCDEAGALLIFDEIQCGVGRCGAFTAAESYGVTPDVLTLAKGLAAGLPIGAMIASGAAASVLKPGDLGSTFGGGPVVCAAALANLAVIEREGLIGNAAEIGAYLKARALELGVPEVTGRGLLIGLQLDRPAAPVQQALFKHRILTGTAASANTLRLMPPLCLSKSEADLFLNSLEKVLS